MYLRTDAPQLAPVRDWPRGFPRAMTPRARLTGLTPFSGGPHLERVLDYQARRRLATVEAVRNGGLTQTYSELVYTNRADHTAVSNSAAEASLIAGPNEQPVIPALYFDGTKGYGRSVTLQASGVLGTTSTPTIIFQVRFGTTAGSSYLSGTSVGVSAAITTGSGVSNKWWFLQLDLTCNTPGIGTGNTTLSGAGYVMSPGGFASPFIYPLEPTTPDTATWTATMDAAVTQYVNLSVTWSAASASNTITCKSLKLFGWN